MLPLYLWKIFHWQNSNTKTQDLLIFYKVCFAAKLISFSKQQTKNTTGEPSFTDMESLLLCVCRQPRTHIFILRSFYTSGLPALCVQYMCPVVKISWRSSSVEVECVTIVIEVLSLVTACFLNIWILSAIQTSSGATKTFAQTFNGCCFYLISLFLSHY